MSKKTNYTVQKCRYCGGMVQCDVSGICKNCASKMVVVHKLYMQFQMIKKFNGLEYDKSVLKEV